MSTEQQARRDAPDYLWTDDPRWLLYLQDTDDTADRHLFRVDLEAPDRPAADLTPLPPGSRVFTAHPLTHIQGAVLVSMNEEPTLVDYFLIDVATGQRTTHLPTGSRRLRAADHVPYPASTRTRISRKPR